MKRVNERVFAEQMMIANGHSPNEAKFLVSCWSESYIHLFVTGFKDVKM